MRVTIIDDDILNCKEDIIGHQVNCQGVMGAGVAMSLRINYPDLYSEYAKYCDKYSPHELLSKRQIVKSKTSFKYIANLFGQLNCGRQRVRYTDYDALKESLLSLKSFASKHSLSVALPYNIGCGLANGDWDMVFGIIEEVFSDYDVTLYRI